MVLRSKTQRYVDRDKEDNCNELTLDISQFGYADKGEKLVIRCDKVQSPVISGLMLVSRPRCSDIKPLPHSSYLHVKSCAKLLSVTSLRTNICSETPAGISLYFEALQVRVAMLPTPHDTHIHIHIHTLLLDVATPELLGFQLRGISDGVCTSWPAL